MQKRPRFEVQTKYGWFSLDEGAYQDYIAGKLWITWPHDGKSQKNNRESVPTCISDEAIRLRGLADKLGVCQTLDAEYRDCMPCIPYVARMEGISIDELNLSVRASNGLMRAGLHTFGKLHHVFTQEGGIFKIRNLGVKSEREIRITFIEECYLQMLPNEKAEYWQSFLDRMK